MLLLVAGALCTPRTKNKFTAVLSNNDTSRRLPQTYRKPSTWRNTPPGLDPTRDATTDASFVPACLAFSTLGNFEGLRWQLALFRCLGSARAEHDEPRTAALRPVVRGAGEEKLNFLTPRISSGKQHPPSLSIKYTSSSTLVAVCMYSLPSRWLRLLPFSVKDPPLSPRLFA